MAIIIRGGRCRLAFKQRAKLYLALKMYRQAIFDISSQLKLTPSNTSAISRRSELISELEWTQRLLLMTQVKNLYEMLNLDYGASVSEVHTSFKIMAMSMHPGSYTQFYMSELSF